MATHSGVLAWRIPGMAEPSGLPSMGLHRVGHHWSDLAAAAAAAELLQINENSGTFRSLFVKDNVTRAAEELSLEDTTGLVHCSPALGSLWFTPSYTEELFSENSHKPGPLRSTLCISSIHSHLTLSSLCSVRASLRWWSLTVPGGILQQVAFRIMSYAWLLHFILELQLTVIMSLLYQLLLIPFILLWLFC